MIRAGAETIVMNYYRHLDKSRFHVDFLCHGYDEGAFDIEIENSGSTIYRVCPRTQLLRNMHEISKVLRDGNYDIVHSHDDVQGGIAMYVAKRCNVPVRIAHSHNTHYYATNKVKLAFNKLFKFMAKKYATDYMACSKMAGQFMFDDEPFYEMSNAIELNDFRFNNEVRERTREALGYHADDDVLISVARFNFQKNHVFMLKIFEALLNIDTNAKLLLVGDGENFNEIKSYCKNHTSLCDTVRFLGVRTDISELLSAADLFLMPSLFEGLPVTGVEAQANGLPCVFSDTITKEVNILPDTKYVSLNESPEKWAEEICETLNNCNKHARTSDFELLTEKGFNLEREAEKLQNYYINKVAACKR